MTTNNKDFKVKNGLEVAGTATFNDNLVIGLAPLRYNGTTSRLQVQIDNIWTDLAFTSDIVISDISLEDLDLAIDYNGNPTYIVQGNGINVSGEGKIVDGGIPTTAVYSTTWNAGVIAV